MFCLQKYPVRVLNSFRYKSLHLIFQLVICVPKCIAFCSAIVFLLYLIFKLKQISIFMYILLSRISLSV